MAGEPAPRAAGKRRVWATGRVRGARGAAFPPVLPSVSPALFSGAC